MINNFKINNFPENPVPDSSIGWAVIVAKYLNQWIFVKHKDRESFETPGGTREKNESIIECAKRELFEETGAIDFEITPLEIYSIKHPDSSVTYGQLFYAHISKRTDLPECEIEEMKLFTKLHSQVADEGDLPFNFQRPCDERVDECFN